MNAALRAFLGAVFGALLTLALHPASRPFILGYANRTSSDVVVSCIDTRPDALSAPRDLVGASLWLQLGLEKLQRSQKLEEKEFESLISVADAAIEHERQNAFWYQAKAVLLWHHNNPKAAAEQWHSAARCDFWKDYQSERLVNSASQLASEVGAHQAWQLNYAYFLRSDAAATLIERMARGFITVADDKSREGVGVRYDSLLNGELLRVGGRAIKVSQHGANIVELSAYPAGLAETLTPRRLWVGQTQLANRLAGFGLHDEMQRTKDAFQSNDAWLALALRDDAATFATSLGLLSTLTAQAPVACLVVSLVGLLIWAVGKLLQQVYGSSKSISPLTLAAIVSVGSTTVYALTVNWIAGLAILLTVGFLAVTSSHPRPTPNPDLGPLFVFVMLVLACTCLIALGSSVMIASGPVNAMFPALGIPEDFVQKPILAALVLILLSLACVASPLWGLVYRVNTPNVLGSAFRSIGAIMSVAGLLLSVMISPICVYADRYTTNVMSQLLLNEPVYYLLQ